MTQNKLRAFFIFGTLVAAFLLVVGFSVKAASAPEAFKEYRNGSSIVLNGRTYLLVTNGSSVEILSFNQANSLVLESELRLPQKIRDVITTSEGNNAYAIVTTGRYLYRVRITDPKNMEVILRHDNYQYSRGRKRTGTVDALAFNGTKLFIAGQYGVRQMDAVNLQVEKILFYEKANGLAVNNNSLYVLGEQKAFKFNLNNGQKIMEVDVKNTDKLIRRIAVDKDNAGYVVGDNSLIKMSNNSTTTYANPVKTINFSYAVVSGGDAIYYVNGLGVTKFDLNFKKQGFFTTAQTKQFGERSFAVGVMVVNVNGGEKVVVMNKSNIVVLSPSLTVVSKYSSSNSTQNNPTFTLSLDHQFLMTNQDITARMAGFYPNETVKLTIGGRIYLARANNQGEAMIIFTTPSLPKKYMIEVSAANSGTNYQESREVK